MLVYFLVAMSFVHCTKPTIHDLHPIVLFTPESREFFGCRINGKSYSPKAADSASLGSCSYNIAYAGNSGGVFNINGDHHESACRFFSLGITLDSIALENGKTFRLGSPGPKKNYGWYAFYTACSQQMVKIYTSDELEGEVTITRFDPDKRIVTGTFDFRLKDANGNLYRVSDGIFDRHFKN